MQLIDGKAINQQMQAEILQQVEEMVKNGQKRPNLAVIQVGIQTDYKSKNNAG